MLKLPYLLLTKLGGIALVACIAWLGWQHLGPRKPDVEQARLDLLNTTLTEIVEDLRVARGEIRKVALLHFENDPSDQFSDRLREAIEKSGIFNLRDRTVWEKAFNILNLRHRAYSEFKKAQRKGNALGMPAVLYGKIHAWETVRGESVLDVELSFAEVETGKVLFSNRYEKNSSDTPAAARVDTLPEPGNRSALLQRLFAWMLLVLLLPVFTIGFLRAMVRKGSNSKNAFVLVVYTAADALLAWLLVGTALNAWGPVLMFTGAVAAAFLYNVRIMTFALKLEEE